LLYQVFSYAELRIFAATKNPMRNKILLAIAAVIIILVIVKTCNHKEPATPKNTAAVKPKPIQPQRKVSLADTGHLVGVWYDESIKTDQGQQVAYEVISKDHKTYMQAITFTGKNLQLSDTPVVDTTVATELKRSGSLFVNAHSPNEIYKVDKAGNLLIYDEHGLVAKCKKIL
jgi:hypothetical protein